MTQLFTNSEQILSCGKSRNDDLFRDTAGCGDSVTAGAGQIIAVGIRSFFYELEIAQALQITGDAGDLQIGQEGFQIGATDAADVELWALQRAQQRMLGLIEEIEAHDSATIDLFGRSKLVEAATAGREVIKCGKEFKVAAVTAQKNLAQINQAVDRLLDSSKFPGVMSIPVFHLHRALLLYPVWFRLVRLRLCNSASSDSFPYI